VLLGLAHFIANAIDARPNFYVLGRAAALAVVVAAGYFTLQRVGEHLAGGSLPPAQVLRGPFDLAVVIVVVLSFAAVTVLQNLLPRQAGTPRWQSLYVHLANGLYVNTVANRLALRYWPPPLRGGSARESAS
jgi:NAD(P)H-quinone oxidoreductase subunit 5